MRPTSRACLIATIMALSVNALAQSAAVPTDFPSDATPLSAADLTARVSGKVLVGTQADGAPFRLDIREGGRYYFDIGRFNGAGTWRVEGSTLCFETARSPLRCGEARVVGDQLYYKRTAEPGEVIRLSP